MGIKTVRKIVFLGVCTIILVILSTLPSILQHKTEPQFMQAKNTLSNTHSKAKTPTQTEILASLQSNKNNINNNNGNNRNNSSNNINTGHNGNSNKNEYADKNEEEGQYCSSDDNACGNDLSWDFGWIVITSTAEIHTVPSTDVNYQHNPFISPQMIYPLTLFNEFDYLNGSIFTSTSSAPSTSSKGKEESEPSSNNPPYGVKLNNRGFTIIR